MSPSRSRYPRFFILDHRWRVSEFTRSKPCRSFRKKGILSNMSEDIGGFDLHCVIIVVVDVWFKSIINLWCDLNFLFAWIRKKYAFFPPSQHDVGTTQLEYKTCRVKSISSATERTMINLTLFVLLFISCSGKSTSDGWVSLSHLCHQTRLRVHQEK